MRSSDGVSSAASANGVVVASDVSLQYPAGRGAGRFGAGRFTAVRGVSLTIHQGELVGLVGETGAGKSTLARAIAGRVGGRGHDGPVVVGGDLSVVGSRIRSIGERSRRRVTAEVGYLPQNAGRLLEAGSTVAENVTAPIFQRDRGFSRREAGIHAAELIDAVQLPLGIMSRYPYELSSGQRQRVAIAKSLILGPSVWVADEPTASVDVTVRGPVLDTLLELQTSREFTALIVSHDAAVMARMTDRVAVMHRGVLVGLGAVQDVLAAPTHPYVRGLAEDYAMRTGPIAVQRLSA